MATAPRLRVRVLRAAAHDAWHDAVVAAIAAVDGVELMDTGSGATADVILDLGGLPSRVSAGETPRLGVWAFAFGDGAPVAAGASGTRARLYRRTSDPAQAVILHEGWYRARTPDGWGTKSVGHRVAPWAARVLRQIQLGHADVVDAAAQPVDGCRDSQPPVRPDSMADDAIEALRDWFTRQRWSVGVVPESIEEILQRGRLPEPSWLRNQPSGRFYADPFILNATEDGLRLLVEEYRYASRRKALCELEVSRDGTIVASRDPAGLPLQASYPFLLRRDRRVFCLPETFRARRLDAFAREDAPAAWSHERTLLDGFPCVDGTLLEHNGRWWLFCTKQGEEDQTELHLYIADCGLRIADAWTGPWQPHPLNPVKSDTRSSRPAGACVEIDGRIYRPAQNCARRYGAGITINRIRDLTPTAFREETALTLLPSRDSVWRDGMHTINGAGGVTVVDGLRIERRWGPAGFVRPPRAASR